MIRPPQVFWGDSTDRKFASTRGDLWGCADSRVSMGYFVSRGAKFVVLVMLASTLVCSELPELTRLMDNPSNDFTLSPSTSADIRVAAGAAQVTATFFLSGVAVYPDFPEASQREPALR